LNENRITLPENAINKNSPVPLYYQLKELLWDIVRHSQTGDAIPTESDICERYDISRPTVRQAVSALETEGYLERRKGKGTFVCEPKIRRDFLLVLESFNKEMTEKGYEPTTRLISIDQGFPDEITAEKLMIPFTRKVYRLRRLRFAQGKPLFVVDSFIAADRVPQLENRDLEGQSLHGILRTEYEYQFGKAIRSIEIKTAEPAEADLLEVEVGSPVHYVETVIYLTDSQPLKFARTWYRGDRSRFTYELSRDSINQHSHDAVYGGHLR
jgi:GntR family transcriptional regulator